MFWKDWKKIRKEYLEGYKNENVETNVMISVVKNSKYSFWKRSNLLNVSKTTTTWIGKSNKFIPYKPKLTNTDKEEKVERRFEFCAFIQGELEDKGFMTRKMFFSDEAIFTLKQLWWSNVHD